jgi:hypothetical protein
MKCKVLVLPVWMLSAAQCLGHGLVRVFVGDGAVRKGPFWWPVLRERLGFAAALFVTSLAWFGAGGTRGRIKSRFGTMGSRSGWYRPEILEAC